MPIESKSLQRGGGWRRGLEGSPVGTQCVGAGRGTRFADTRGLPARGLLAGRAAHTARLGEALAGEPSHSLRPTPSTAQPSLQLQLQSLPPAFSHIYSAMYCSLILVKYCTASECAVRAGMAQNVCARLPRRPGVRESRRVARAATARALLLAVARASRSRQEGLTRRRPLRRHRARDAF